MYILPRNYGHTKILHRLLCLQHTPSAKRKVCEYFMGYEWNTVYDLLEFLANNHSYDEIINETFMDDCNQVLERELSAYRFVDGVITQITSDQESSEIEKAIEDTSPLKPINTHLKTALAMLSDRKSPDYRNSIKESMSAVEAICNLINGGKKTTLGKALKTIGEKTEIHPALEKSFSSMYGYTSDADGIRHSLGLLEEPNLDFEDAKFMLVSCSAFINYLKVKASKAGIKLEAAS